MVARGIMEQVYKQERGLRTRAAVAAEHATQNFLQVEQEVLV